MHLCWGQFLPENLRVKKGLNFIGILLGLGPRFTINFVYVQLQLTFKVRQCNNPRNVLFQDKQKLLTCFAMTRSKHVFGNLVTLWDFVSKSYTRLIDQNCYVQGCCQH